MSKVSINTRLFQRAQEAATNAGYSSVDEFVEHAIEIELKRIGANEAEGQVADQLRGLGYID